MDKEAALLVVAKDLFLEGLKIKSGIIPTNTKPDEILGKFCDEFLAFYNKLKSGNTKQ